LTIKQIKIIVLLIKKGLPKCSTDIYIIENEIFEKNKNIYK